MGQKAEPNTLESSLDRIQSIVREMEDGQLPLETLIDRFEEGVALVKACHEKLAAAEKRIQIITRDATGTPELRDFEEETDR